MNNLANINKGICLAFLTALISGFAVFFNKFSMAFWQDSSVFTTAKNLVTVFFLISVLLLFKKWRDLKSLSKKQWLQLFLIGLVGGSIPFLLFFKGLSLTSSTSAAFIHKTLFVWVALLATPFLKEKISRLQFLALGILLMGVYLFSAPTQFHFGYGEFLAFLATLFWAVENVIAKKVLKNVSSLVVAWGRMFFGSVFLLLFLFATGSAGQLLSPNPSSLGWLLLSGFVLFGYVTTWYSALKYAPATIVSSVLVLGGPITALLNFVFVSHQFNSSAAAVFLISLGVLLITKLFQNYAKRAFASGKVWFAS